ncbi:hypothetical protein BGZ50_003550 [Haplosporangium sp. Z 11]|nr:hypothetical protein BGZ50_003550 [Haplosporangium sp. Z 11]
MHKIKADSDCIQVLMQGQVTANDFQILWYQLQETDQRPEDDVDCVWHKNQVNEYHDVFDLDNMDPRAAFVMSGLD